MLYKTHPTKHFSTCDLHREHQIFLGGKLNAFFFNPLLHHIKSKPDIPYLAVVLDRVHCNSRVSDGPGY
jgi:hypothetical protein